MSTGSCMQSVERLNIANCMARQHGNGIKKEARQTHSVAVREAVTTNQCYATTTCNMQIQMQMFTVLT